MFSTIVWATDGSENADRALSVAKVLARENGASLVVVHVVQRFATETGLAVHADEERVTAKLERVLEELSTEGFNATLQIVNHVGPQAAHEIADVAQKVGADLIRRRYPRPRTHRRAAARKRDPSAASRCAMSGRGRARV